MRRHADMIIFFAVFCGSTAVLIWFLQRIFQDGALSLGAFMDGRGKGPVFIASGGLLAAILSIASGCVLISTFLNYLRERRPTRLRKNRHP